MRYKGFSIIEVIFTLAIISILLIVAVPQIDDLLKKSYKTQIKSTITLIRKGIVKEKNRLLLANSLDRLDSLDDGGENLFSKVLSVPVKESSTLKNNSWQRESQNSYKVYFNAHENIIFTFDPDTYSFDCNFNEPLCKELTE